MKGKNDDECRSELRMDSEDYDNLRKETLNWKAEEIRDKTVGEVYVEYMLNQIDCIRDLEKMCKKFDRVKHYSALVSAVKARSDIHDKIIKMGQEFGILEKRPERKEIVAGVLVAKMDSDQLRNTILGELTNMEKMMEKFGGHDILDLPEPKLHRPIPKVIDMGPVGKKEKKKTKKGHKSRANKVFGGRRIVKKKLRNG